MSDQHKPQLGDWVTFSRYYEKPTSDEVNRRGEDSDGDDVTISYMPRENPNPDARGLVVGVQSVEVEAPVQYSEGAGTWFVSWGQRTGVTRRTFYVVKHNLRDRRYLVALEDIQLQNGGHPA